MTLTLTIDTNRLTNGSAHYALGLAGLGLSWDAGERDGQLVVRNLDKKDVAYLPDMIQELLEQEIPFRLETEKQ